MVIQEKPIESFSKKKKKNQLNNYSKIKTLGENLPRQNNSLRQEKLLQSK